MKKIPIAVRNDHAKLYFTLLVAAILLFVFSARAALSGQLLPWEKEMLLSIYNWPSWLRPIGIAITQFGSAGVAVLISLILLTGREKSQHRGRLVLANCAVTYGLVAAAKLLVGRPRPVELVQNLQQYDILVSGLGYPSGHTALATVISLVLIPFMPRNLRLLPLLWIVLVGVSRVYLGVHAPLDIAGGFALGLAVVSAQRLLRVR